MEIKKFKSKETEGIFFDGEHSTTWDIINFLESNEVKLCGYIFDREENYQASPGNTPYTKIKFTLRVCSGANVNKVEVNVKDFVTVKGTQVYVFPPEDLENMFGKEVFEGTEFKEAYFKR